MREINIRNESMEDVMDFQATRMFLYDIHDNVELYLTEVCLNAAEVLSDHEGPREQVKYIKSILSSMDRHDYTNAWRGMIAFSLLPGVLKMYDFLDSSMEPGLKALSELAPGYNIG